jgi:hypothetical protein
MPVTLQFLMCLFIDQILRKPIAGVDFVYTLQCKCFDWANLNLHCMYLALPCYHSKFAQYVSNVGTLSPNCKRSHSLHIICLKYAHQTNMSKTTVSIMDNLAEKELVIGFDSEWNVDFSANSCIQHHGPTAIVQIVFQDQIFIFRYRISAHFNANCNLQYHWGRLETCYPTIVSCHSSKFCSKTQKSSKLEG